MVTCENEHCQRVFKSHRTDGKLARFCCRACCTAVYRGSAHARWKGSGDYSAIHTRVRVARGAAKTYPCEHCGRQARDWARCHGKSGMSPDDFMPLCRSCHIRYDTEERSGRGTAAKLTWKQVREIRALYGQVTQTKLGEIYGVSRSTIRFIVTGQTWVE